MRAVNLDWRVKSVVQRAVGWMPRSLELNHLLQRHVTRSVPPSPARLEETREAARWIFEQATAAVPRPVEEQHWMEFGCGWHLGAALALHGMGVRRQSAFDLSPVARPELVRHAMAHFATPIAAHDGDPTVRELVAPLGITYVAPGDARATGLAGGSVDVVHSTSVLEHVPVDDLRAILREARRVLAPDGVCVFVVDHHDHWASADSSIGGLNFLRYPERRWRLWNCPMQYQNRLRHDDYVGLFHEAGFELLTEVAIADDALVPPTDLAPQFAGRRDLHIGDSRVVLRAAST